MSVTKVKQKNKVVYRAQVYIRGVRLASQVFPNKSLAYQWHDIQKKKLENPEQARRQKAQDMSFQELLDLFKKERIPHLRKYTQTNYIDNLRYFKESSLLNTKMSDFSSETVDFWLTWLLKQPTTRTKKRKSLAKNLTLLHSILNWYRNYINADFNVPIVKKHRERCFYKKLPPRRPDYFARPDEVRNWIKELQKSSNPAYWKLAQFMILTGARVGEACGLMWKEVDLERKFVRVVRVVRWDYHTKKPYVEESTKTDESTGLLMIPESLVKTLKNLKEDSRSDFVFCNKSSEPLRYNSIQSAFNRAFETLGLPWRSTHICRHTYATMALMATKDISAVQASLGHKDQKVTQRYAKAIALLSSETAEKTEKMFDLGLDDLDDNN